MQLILSHVRSGYLALVVSPVHDIEINAIDDPVERRHLWSILRQLAHDTAFDLGQTRRRAEEFVHQGLGPADAAHVAFAEQAEASFITCDDRLIRSARLTPTTVWYGTPVASCEKENLG